jgi:hypothetical protein
MRNVCVVGGLAFAIVVTIAWIGLLAYEIGYEVEKIIDWLL